MAEVAVAVAGRLQRAEHERCIRRPAVAAALGLARDQPARLARRARPPRSGESFSGSGGVGRSSAASCSNRTLDPLRVGLLVDPVERRHAAALAELGDLLVGEDHQLLDQPVGLGLRDRVRRDHVARRRRTRTRARRLETSSAPPRRRSRERRGGAAGERERLGDPLRRPLAAGEERGRAGRSRAARRSGSGCGRSSPSAARRPRRARSRRSPRAARRPGRGCRRRAQSASGSIGSTVPGT